MTVTTNGYANVERPAIANIMALVIPKDFVTYACTNIISAFRSTTNNYDQKFFKLVSKLDLV